MHLLIAARKSDLARLQALQVGRALEKCHPNLEVQYHFRESLGDINQEDPLWKMPEKGVFTEDFRQGLLDGQWDMVVHSWKDLPIEQEIGTKIVATLPRADSRDLLLFKKNNLDRVRKRGVLKLFSSSPRRIYNLDHFFQDHFPASLNEIHFDNVRGNILTRVRKMFEAEDVDGLVVAKAALDRLLGCEGESFEKGKLQLKSYLENCLWQVLPLSLNPTAAAQGALAVEVATGRTDLIEKLAGIHCQKTWDAVIRERQILKNYGGGCHQKIGVSCLKKDYGDITYLRGETESGMVLRAASFDTSHINLKAPYHNDESWFEREPIPYQFPENANAHYISRSTALPEDVVIPVDKILWVSGLRTWKKLAQRGMWVNGTSDSLGEQEDLGLGALTSDLRWAKWGHDASPVSSWAESVGTYRLKPLPIREDLKKYTDFFWMSGSQFLKATTQFPSILHAQHFCGPGNTHSIICETLANNGIKRKPTRLPGYSVWQRLLKEGS